MFEVGFTEIVLILGLALLVLGPEKLPGLAQKVGRWTGRARSMARQLRNQLEQEVTLEELAKSRPPPAPAAEPATSAGDASTAAHMQSHAPSSYGTYGDATAPHADAHVSPPPYPGESDAGHAIDSNNSGHADIGASPAPGPDPAKTP